VSAIRKQQIHIRGPQEYACQQCDDSGGWIKRLLLQGTAALKNIEIIER
jgi:hypothetical protein